MDAKRMKETLRKHALRNGVDMVGFANIDRWDNAPAEFHPRNIYPRTKTVVVLGIRVLRGLLESLDTGLRIPYNAHGYGGINAQFMVDAKQLVACWIEDHGFAGVPVVQWTGTPHQEPIICHRTAAFLAGLGKFGWSKTFITKRFGPLQRFGIVLTDAELPSDQIVEDKICDQCKACVRACPSGAIPKDNAVSFTMAGHTVTHARVDMFKCTIGHHGAVKATHPCPPDDFDISVIETKYAKLRKANRDDTDDYALGARFVREVQAKYPHPLYSLVSSIGHTCAHCGASGCYRACLEHLEKSGLLDEPFKRPFRGTEDGDKKMKPSPGPAAVDAVRKASGSEVHPE